VVAMEASTARPMALSLDRKPTWYTFVINDRIVKKISPGQTVSCAISFVNHEDAAVIFHPSASILFGDGVCTRGVIRIVAFG